MKTYLAIAIFLSIIFCFPIIQYGEYWMLIPILLVTWSIPFVGYYLEKKEDQYLGR